MFVTTINEEEKENYSTITVDGKKFYKKKQNVDLQKKVSPNKRVKRYSDQFKDPSYEKKDILRKLKMVQGFNEKNGDLDLLIDKWRDCIDQCIVILQKEYGLPAHQIFKAFSLKKHGFNYEDYDNNSEVEEENDKEEEKDDSS